MHRYDGIIIYLSLRVLYSYLSFMPSDQDLLVMICMDFLRNDFFSKFFCFCKLLPNI